MSLGAFAVPKDTVGVSKSSRDIASRTKPTVYTVETVPNIRLKDKTQYVSDPDHLLSAIARDSINTMLAGLETTTGIETAVVMLPSIGSADIFDFAHNLFRTWGIGKKKNNNGMLILYVEDIRKIRFTTGYGLEGTMTDAMSKRIQTRYMVPAFRGGYTDAGMVNGTRAVCKVLDGSMKPDKESEDDIDPIISVIILLALFGFGVFLFLRNEKKNSTCKYCKKKALRKMSSDKYKAANGHTYQKDIYICGNCGKLTERTTDLGGDDNGSGGAFLTGMFLGSMFGGHRGGGGGGFSGGSFGGGSTGGGGSTSGW